MDSPLTAAEQAQLRDKVRTWKNAMIGREVVKAQGKTTVEGVIWGVESEDLMGPTSHLVTHYSVLWDVEGQSKKKERPLKDMHPGADGVKREVITNEDLDQGPYTLRTGFSHMELPRPHKILQPRGWRTSKLSHEAQRDLLNWTPEEQRQQWRADKLAMQKPILDALRAEKRQNQAANGVDASDEAEDDDADDEEEEVVEEDVVEEDGSSDGDDDDDNEVPEVVPSSKKRGRGATARQGSSASKATAPSAKRSKPVAKPAAKSAAKPAAKGGGRKQAAPQPRGVSTGLSPNAMLQRFVGAGRAVKAAASAAISSSAEPAMGSNDRARRSAPAAQEAESEVHEADSDEVMEDAVSGDVEEFDDAQEEADDSDAVYDFIPNYHTSQASPTSGGRGSGARGSPAASPGMDGGGGADEAEDPFSAAAADEDCVVLPPGCFPARIPFIQTLTDGDKLLQEYKETDFAPDQEFVPDFIVAQRPKDAPREFLVKWKGFELDPGEWTEYGLLEEAAALEVWERAHPPPQGLGNPPLGNPPPLLSGKTGSTGKTKGSKKGSKKRKW